MSTTPNPSVWELLGCFKLPRLVEGVSTAYAPGCIAVRNGRILSTDNEHRVYETKVPALGTYPPKRSTPAPAVNRVWPNPFGTVRPAGASIVHLRASAGRLAANWGEPYNTEDTGETCYGTVSLPYNGASGVPWGARDNATPYPQQRGGSLVIPKWYAKKYTSGRQLGLGFGGYYSISSMGVSYGPALWCDGKPILSYTEERRCIRPAGYYVDAEGWVGRDPVDGVGFWTAADEIGGDYHAGGGYWFETQTTRGLVFTASLGMGKIAYVPGGIHQDERRNFYLVYPTTMLEVIAGKYQQDWPLAATTPIYVPALPTGRIASMAVDGNKVYTVYTQADPDEFESYPICVVHKLP